MGLGGAGIADSCPVLSADCCPPRPTTKVQTPSRKGASVVPPALCGCEEASGTVGRRGVQAAGETGHTLTVTHSSQVNVGCGRRRLASQGDSVEPGALCKFQMGDKNRFFTIELSLLSVGARAGGVTMNNNNELESCPF